MSKQSPRNVCLGRGCGISMSSDESIHALWPFPKRIRLSACLQVQSETIKEFNRRARLSLLRNHTNQAVQIPARYFVAQGSDKLAHKSSSPTVTTRCLVLGLNTPKIDRQRWLWRWQSPRWKPSSRTLYFSRCFCFSVELDPNILLIFYSLALVDKSSIMWYNDMILFVQNSQTKFQVPEVRIYACLLKLPPCALTNWKNIPKLEEEVRSEKQRI